MELPKHISFSLSHNECAGYYETVKQIAENQPDYFGVDYWISPEQFAKGIEENSIWTAHWYPNTPVGFVVLHAADLDPLLAAINET